MTHELKAHPSPFADVWSGQKTYEIRRWDRPFAVGDTLWLREWEPVLGQYTGRAVHVRVTHTTPPGQWGLPDGIGVLGFAAFRHAEDVTRLRRH